MSLNFKSLFFILIIINLYGCGTKVFNPYEKEFSCPETYNGKCTTLDNAYEESLKKTGSKEFLASASNAEKDYLEKKFVRLKNLLNEEKAPLIVPPLTKRALILPYEVGSAMYSSRKVYFFVEDAKFQLPPLK